MHPTRITCLLAGFLVLMAVPTNAQGGRTVDLSYDWPVGTARTYDVQTQSEIEDQTGNFRVAIDLVVAESIEPDPEINQGIRVTRRIDQIRLELQHPLIGNASFDSETGKRSGPDALIAPFQTLLGRSSVWVFDADGQLHSAEGSLEQAITESGLLPGIGRIQPPDPHAIADKARATLAVIPGKPVKRGETWSSSLKQSTPAGDITIEQTHALSRFDARRNIAIIETEGRFDPSAGAIEIQGGSMTSNTRFDPERGVIIEQTTKTSFNANVSVPGISGESRRITQTAQWQLRDAKKARRSR